MARSPEQLLAIRESEAVNAARELGVGALGLHFARFPDGGIRPADLGQVGVVVRLLRELRPALVYLLHAGGCLVRSSRRVRAGVATRSRSRARSSGLRS